MSLLFTIPTALLAQQCDTLKSGSIALAPGIESSFLKGDFSSFMDGVSISELMARDQYEEMERLLYQSFPSGFQTCRHILYEEMSSAMSRMAIEFIGSNGSSIFLMLVFLNAELEGDQPEVVKVLVTASFGDLYSEW